jgi:HEAT repeat protein
LYKRTELHPRLEALQYLDFTSYNHRPWDELIGAVTRASSQQDTPRYIKQAIDAINNVNPHDREGAINTLADAKYSKVLVEALSHPFQDVRSNASCALGKIKDETAVPLLLEALNDSDAKARRNSSWALGEIKSSLAVPGLIKAVNDSDFAVRLNSIKALGAIKAVTAIPILIEATQDPNEHIQKLAQGALKRINKG